MNRETIIGILGGMGPYATNFFFKRFLDITPVNSDKEHFRTIIDNNVKIPSRTREVKYNEQSPVDDIVTNSIAFEPAPVAALPTINPRVPLEAQAL